MLLVIIILCKPNKELSDLMFLVKIILYISTQTLLSVIFIDFVSAGISKFQTDI